ncbi:MAG: efflux RND transporter periplasmic adaptor subunit [Thermotaleaceae bacterium]
MKRVLANKIFRGVMILLILGGAGVIGFGHFNQTAQSSSEAVTVKEESVRRGDLTIAFSGDGKSQIPTVNLDFNLTGKLKELYVKVDDEIQVGQLLAKLDDTEYIKRLKTAQINYDKALLSLEQKKQNNDFNLVTEKQKLDELKLKLDQTEMEYEPMLEMKEYYSKQELEIKKMAYESAKSAYEIQLERYEILSNSNLDIELEEANLETVKIALETAQDDLDNTILRSPTHAKVLNIANKPGETISAPSDSGEITADTKHFLVVSDAQKVEVIVPVSELDLSNVSVGQNVEVVFEAIEGEVFTGKVISIASLHKVDQNSLVTYDVKIELDSGFDQIKSGMTCSVSFILRQEKNVLSIPNKAVKMVDGKQRVKVKSQNGEVEERNIKTGLTDGKYVEVTEGLNGNETVLVENSK